MSSKKNITNIMYKFMVKTKQKLKGWTMCIIRKLSWKCLSNVFLKTSQDLVCKNTKLEKFHMWEDEASNM